MSRELEGWSEADYIAEIESLRSQLALLGGAAIAVSRDHPGIADVLIATPYLRELPSANRMIEYLIEELPNEAG